VHQAIEGGRAQRQTGQEIHRLGGETRIQIQGEKLQDHDQLHLGPDGEADRQPFQSSNHQSFEGSHNL
jgi:hypothetical protein